VILRIICNRAEGRSKTMKMHYFFALTLTGDGDGNREQGNATAARSMHSPVPKSQGGGAPASLVEKGTGTEATRR
jgi:hypothetical protein